MRRTGKKRSSGSAYASDGVAALLLTLLACLLLPAASLGAPVSLGSYIPHADESPALIDSFAQEVDWKPVILDSFKTFDQAPIYYPQLNAMRASGAVPMITWEPQTSSEGRISLSISPAGATTATFAPRPAPRRAGASR